MYNYANNKLYNVYTYIADMIRIRILSTPEERRGGGGGFE